MKLFNRCCCCCPFQQANKKVSPVTLFDTYFIVEAEGKKLRVSYAEFNGNHEDAMKFCKENGGGDETVENWRFLARYRDVINEELERLGKARIGIWYWANEKTWWDKDRAFVVYTFNGYVSNDYRYVDYYARAVSAL